MVAVFGLPSAWHGRTLTVSRIRGHFQMRVEQRYPGVEVGFDLGEIDFGLALDLLMDGVVLRPLGLDLRLVRGDGLIGLRLCL